MIDAGVVGVVLKEFFNWLLRWPRKKRSLELMTNSVDIDLLAQNMVDDGGNTIDFFYLMLAYNGRKKHKDHRFKNRNIIAGHHNEHLVHNFSLKNYRKIPLDVEYSSLLEVLEAANKVSVTTEKMGDGSLKAKLKTWNLKFVRYYMLKETREGLWYLMVGSTEARAATDFDTNDYHVHNMDVAIAHLKNIIDK